MKTRTFRTACVFLFALASLVVKAQEDDGPPPGIPTERLLEIKAQKSAYITQRLGLTPEEAQKFWPVYNQYDNEIEAVRKEMRDERPDRKNTSLTEAEASKAIDSDLAGRQKELDIRKRYAAEFKKNIGAVKTLQLARAERDFNRELLKRMRPPENGHGGHPSRH